MGGHGAAVFAAAFALGLFYFAPHGKRLAVAVEQHGATSAEAQAIARRMEAATWFELALLLVAVFAMTVKPSL